MKSKQPDNNLILVVNMSSSDRFLNSKPALGALYIYSALKGFYKKRKIDFINIATDPDFNVIYYVKKNHPAFICVSLMESYLSKTCYKIMKEIKKINPHITIIAGGVHSSSVPEETIKYADFVIHGEGEDTITELISTIENGLQIKNIKGVWYKDLKKIKFTGYRNNIPNLDKLPPLSLALNNINLSNYNFCSEIFNNEPSFHLLSSEGCINRCFFCSYQNIYPLMQYRSIEKILKDIETIITTLGIFNFEFYDDIFTNDYKRVENFCKEIIKRKLPIKWRCMTRADLLTPKLLKIMYKAGCRNISIGLESGDQKVLDAINKNVKLKQCEQVYEWMKSTGIKNRTYIMVGLPEQDTNSILKTILFLKKIRPDDVSVELFMPFPGSVFYRFPEKYGINILNRDFSHYKNIERSQTEVIQPVSETKWLSKEQIIESRKIVRNAVDRISSLGKFQNKVPTELWNKKMTPYSITNYYKSAFKLYEVEKNILLIFRNKICITSKEKNIIRYIGNGIVDSPYKKIHEASYDDGKIAVLLSYKGTPHYKEIHIFDINGKEVKVISKDKLKHIVDVPFASDELGFFGGINDILLNKNKLYITFYLPGPTNFLNKTIKKFKKFPAIYVFNLESSRWETPIGKGVLKHPNHIFIIQGKIYVSDGEEMGCIKIFSLSGRYIKTFRYSKTNNATNLLITGFNKKVVISKPNEGIYIYNDDASYQSIIPTEILGVDRISSLTMKDDNIYYSGSDETIYKITLNSNSLENVINKNKTPLSTFLSREIENLPKCQNVLVSINDDEYKKIGDFLINRGINYKDANLYSNGNELFFKISINLLKKGDFLRDLIIFLKN